MNPIHFHTEDISFEITDPDEISKWIKDTVNLSLKTLAGINFIFCSDEYLLQINKDYLNHHYYTDVITFDNSDSENDIEGDIFISIPRIEENAKNLSVSFREELHRVLLHGVLHLLGMSDATEVEKEQMRKTEDHYLALRKFT